jgi:hypothetical protein
VIIRAQWTLSEDGKTLKDAFTQYLPDGTALFSQPLPDGSSLFLPYVYERSTPGSGIIGTWDSRSASVRSGIELQILPYEAGGLSFKRSDEQLIRKILLDGDEHPDLDANGRDSGSAYLAQRVAARRLEISAKLKGKITSTRKFELSPDLKTLTITEQFIGEGKPKSVMVFDRG